MGSTTSTTGFSRAVSMESGSSMETYSTTGETPWRTTSGLTERTTARTCPQTSSTRHPVFATPATRGTCTGTLNMYFNEYFMGDEEFAYQDSPLLNYDNRAQSIILTGYQYWTIYQYPNYQGYSACLAPGNNGFPGFYSTQGSLHSLANDVSSIAMGCHSNVRLYPDNHRMRMANGTNGFSSFH